MPSVTSILGNPISDITAAASSLIGRFVADPTAKLQAQSELSQLQATMQAKILDADTAMANAQRDSVVAEEKGESWLQRNWRPIIMLEFGFIIGYNYIIAPMRHITPLPPPDQLWDIMKLGMTGYIAGRSAEKIAPHIAAAFNGGGKSDSSDKG